MRLRKREKLVSNHGARKTGPVIVQAIHSLEPPENVDDVMKKYSVTHPDDLNVIHEWMDLTRCQVR